MDFCMDFLRAIRKAVKNQWQLDAAAFFAFSPLLPEAAASVGMNAAILAVPVQLSAGIARTMCPIAGVMIAVSSIAGITPFQIVRRTIPVMAMALVVNVAASAIFL